MVHGQMRDRLNEDPITHEKGAFSSLFRGQLCRQCSLLELENCRDRVIKYQFNQINLLAFVHCWKVEDELL